jgi:hypothetical protein
MAPPAAVVPAERLELVEPQEPARFCLIFLSNVRSISPVNPAADRTAVRVRFR